MIYLFFIFLLFCLVLIVRPITTIIHELGHAIPAILLTRQKVTIYIGSHGDPNKSFHFQLGKLEVYFRFNILEWQLGLCVPSAAEISVLRQFIYTLTGPMASTIIAVIATYFVFGHDMHGFLKLFFIIFLASAVLDLFVNLIPIKIPIRLYDGSTTFNDGYSLKMLVKYWKIQKPYAEAASFFQNGQYADAASAAEKLLKTNPDSDDLYRIQMYSNYYQENFEKVGEVCELFERNGTLSSDDYCLVALAYANMELYDEAVGSYDKSLQLNPDNGLSLNNKGYTLNLIAQYEAAIACFDKAIGLGAVLAYAYNNRGLAKIKLNQTADGLKDIEHSLSLDSENSYAHRNLGIYHADRNEHERALHLFEKAKALDGKTHMIDDLIAEMKKKLNRASALFINRFATKIFLSFLLFAAVAFEAPGQSTSEYKKIVGKFEQWKSIQYKNGKYETQKRCHLDTVLADSYTGPGIGIPDEIDIFFTEINGDNKLDALITFHPDQCDGGNALMNAQVRVLIVSSGGSYITDDNFVEKIEKNFKTGWLNIERAADGTFYGTYYEYKDGDGRCCPSIRKAVEINYKTKKLIYADR